MLGLAGTALAVFGLVQVQDMKAAQSTAGIPKIGFVRSNDLIAGYPEFASAKATLENEAQGMQHEADDLEQRMTKLQQEAAADGASWSTVKKKEKSAEMQQIQEKYQALSSKVKARQSEVMEPLLQKLNAKVQEYGQKEHYTVIFGTESAGVIVYGQPAADVTEAILASIKQGTK